MKLNLAILSLFSVGSIRCFDIFGAFDAISGTLSHMTNCNYIETCTPECLSYDIDGLELDLKEKVFGQHIVYTKLISAFLGHVKNIELSKKPLVMTFHGPIGTGKNHVTNLIIRRFYKYGEDSKFVHRYYGRKDFPIESQVNVYRTRLWREILDAIIKCKRSIFVFDEIEHMSAGIFEMLFSILDYHNHIGYTDFRHAIFIFLTNAGGNAISNVLEGLMARGVIREQTKIQDFEPILETYAENINDKMKSIVTSGLIDHFIPFLPLERRHIADCVRIVYKKLNRKHSREDIRYVVQHHVSFLGPFSKYGCKRLDKQIQAIVEECYDEQCNLRCIPYDIDGLKSDLEQSVFGQHIAIDTIIPALRNHVENLDRSKKPLILSFNGPEETDKSHVVELIIKHLYKKGENSKYVLRYRGSKDFPLVQVVDKYGAHLVKDFKTKIQSCKRSMFIFDDVDMMPAGVLDRIEPLLDDHIHTDSKDFRQAIVIFTSNAGGEGITNRLDQMITEGTPREKIRITDFEHIAAIATRKIGGLRTADIITTELIDNFIPFLPLERRHIESCVRAEFLKFNPGPREEDINDFVKFASFRGLFSEYGCRKFLQKTEEMIKPLGTY